MDPSFVGSIFMWAGTRIPSGWVVCNGALLSISDYELLYSVIGTTYGGDGVTSFGVPKLTGQFPMGAPVPTQTGKSAGIPTANALTTAMLVNDNLPPHDHPATVSLANLTGQTTIKVGTGTAGGLPVASNLAVLTSTPNTAGAAAIYLPATTPTAPVQLGGVTTSLTEPPTATVIVNQTAHAGISSVNTFATTPPSVAINYIICTNGLYPTRP